MRRHFETHFLEWKSLYSDYNFTEICSQGSNLQYSSMGSDNGLVPARRQAIIWTNDGYFTDWRIYASVDLDGLTPARNKQRVYHST